MHSCVNNNSMLAVGRTPNLGSVKKISHRASLAPKRSSTRTAHGSSRHSGSQPSSNASVIVHSSPQSPTSPKSQLSQSLPTKRRHSRTKVTLEDHEPLSRGKSDDSPTDRDDVVTDVAASSSRLNQVRGSVKSRNNATRGQRGTSTSMQESASIEQSHLPFPNSKTRRLHVYDIPNHLDLDTVASRQESRVNISNGTSTASLKKTGATGENTSVKTSRGFRARLMLSQARKTIENHKPVWSESAITGTASDRRKRSRYKRRPFIMDIILELKAQYAGYTTEDMYITFEALRRKEDARPVFDYQYLAHDFSAGVESVDAYWNSQASVWRHWKTPTAERDVVDSVGGSTFPTRSSLALDPVVYVPQDPASTPSSSSLRPSSLGRAHFPDSIERSTASWCPVLNCDYVAGYHSHPQDYSLPLEHKTATE